ncbi:hypothetical protein AB0C15_02015 [Micromonospora sp. NPDC048835]|uniref:hypothetical protein n=1 Tax=Micromonospora sp. NPDC048835 TaxID=3155147 RepID=UPI0033CFCBEC
MAWRPARLIAVLTASLIACGLVVAPQAASAPAAAAATPDTFTNQDVGFAESSLMPHVDSDQEVARHLDKMAEFVPGRSPIVRVWFDWWYVEGAPGELRWDRVERQVAMARARGMRVMLMFGLSAPWANGHRNDEKQPELWLPLRDEDWRSIIDRTMARLTAPDGTPLIDAFEVWNEPNLTGFGKWDGNGDGTFDSADYDAIRLRYWQLVDVAYRAVHARCASCVVVAGGSGGLHEMTGHPDRTSSAWLDWAYENGFGNSFDAVAHHPYSDFHAADEPNCAQPWLNAFGPPYPDAQGRLCGELARLHDVMVRHGDTTRKIWATEWGYNIGKRGDLNQPAALFRDWMVNGIKLWRSLPYTGPLFLFTFSDVSGCPGEPACEYGIVDEEYVPKDQELYDAVSDTLTYPDWRPSFTSAGSGIGGFDLNKTQDRIVAFDYLHRGKLDHLLIYRPGTGIVWIVERRPDGTFAPVFTSTTGIGGFDLKGPQDQVIAYDYYHTGKLDTLVLYRPGQGAVFIVTRAPDGTMWPVHRSASGGIGGFNLNKPQDRIVAFDHQHTGNPDHLALYRPETGILFVVQHRPDDTFAAVFRARQGVAGFNLGDASDQMISYDMDHEGRPDRLLMYRPGDGDVAITGP